MWKDKGRQGGGRGGGRGGGGGGARIKKQIFGEATRTLNDEIAQHASRKQLTEALALFERAKRENLANEFTFGNVINAQVRV
jgi:hypothetical protein